MKRLLCVFAHPDDESFGPGAALALWARSGVNILVVCATKGERGGDPEQRTQELLSASRILGINKTIILTFPDGKICNEDIPKLESIIKSYIQDFCPDAVLTFDLNGISGHLDHIAVASATTQAFVKSGIAKKLYYYVTPKAISDEFKDYFVFFPEGKKKDEVDEIISVRKTWSLKIRAMMQHSSQIKDAKKLIELLSKFPKENWFQVRKRSRP